MRRILASTSLLFAEANAFGVGNASNKAGVILLTAASVVCADKTTATNNSKGF